MQTSLLDSIEAACLSPDGGGAVTFETAGCREAFSLAELVTRGEDFWRRCGPPARRGGDRTLVLIAMSVSPDALGIYLAAIRLGLVPAFLAPMTEKQQAGDHWSTLEALCRNTCAAVLCVDDAAVADVRANLDCPELIVAAPSAIPATSGFDPLQEFQPEPEDVAFLQFSSGTTGLRKAVAITHGMLDAQIDSYGAALDCRAGDVMVSWLPLYHDMGLIACLMLPVLRDMRLVLLDPLEWVRQPRTLFAAIARHGGTHCFLPNFAFNHLALTVPADCADDLSSMRAFVNCSEPCTASAFERFATRFGDLGVARGQLRTCYAMAEAVFAVTQSRPGRSVRALDELAAPSFTDGAPIARDVLSSGRPIDGIAVEIRDSEKNPLPDGVVGEIHIAGAMLFDDYADTRRAGWTRGPACGGGPAWFATGDLGLIAEGELFVVGRSKDVIIVNGRNLLAHEIEAIASDVPGVKPGRTVAFGSWQDAVGSETLVLLAEPAGPDGGEEEWRGLSRSLRQRISERTGVHPTVRIVPPRSLVKTTSGKLCRQRNKHNYENGLRC